MGEITIGIKIKNKISILLTGIFIISGIGTVTISSEAIYCNNINCHFSNLSIIEKDEGIILELDGTNSLFLETDFYMVPTRIETFIYPFETKIINVECTARNIHEQELKEKLIISPEPMLFSQSDMDSEEVADPLSVNIWYDYRIGCGIIDNQRKIIVNVEVFPVQYYSENNIIKWAETIEIEIKFQEPKYNIISFDESYDLVILSPSDFSEELGSLVDHKLDRDLSTKLITLEEIYSGSYFPVQGRDNPEKIKYFIKNAIEQWNIRYVLLVGGSDIFPTRDTHVYVDYGDGDGEIFVSDLYYADIYNESSEFSSWDSNENDVFGEYDWGSSHETDDVDLFPDVYVGRLACTDDSELIACINKIIDYENNEAYAKNWFNNLIVIGGDTSPNDDENILEGEYVNQAIIDIMDGFIPIKCWASEGTLNRKTEINDAINDGAGFVDFSGHGNPSSWVTHPYNKSDVWIPLGDYKNTHVSSLNNNGKLPIVVTGACSVAKYNEKSDCFTWSFVANQNGGGIASVGPAALSWGYSTSYVTKDLGGKMQLELFKAYRIHGAFTFGEMWSKAIGNYITTRMDGGDHKTIEEWQPFGDPSLAIAVESESPNTPNAPDGPITGSADNVYTYSAITTDPEGDKISYLFDWGNGDFSVWSEFVNSGQTVSLDYTWDSSGTYEIRVKAKDDHGIQSEWSESLEVSMPKPKLFDQTPQIILWLFERFPFLQPYLNFL